MVKKHIERKTRNSRLKEIFEKAKSLYLSDGEALLMINYSYGYTWKTLPESMTDEILLFLAGNYLDRYRITHPQLHQFLLEHPNGDYRAACRRAQEIRRRQNYAYTVNKVELPPLSDPNKAFWRNPDGSMKKQYVESKNIEQVIIKQNPSIKEKAAMMVASGEPYQPGQSKTMDEILF